jgi:predicted metal-binding membrane protein
LQGVEVRSVPALPSRDRLIILGALGALTGLAWACLTLAPMPMPMTSGGLRTPHYFALTFAMWLVMMVGMMTPSVAPTVLLFDRIARRAPGGRSLARTAAFGAGYLIVWLGFSAAATALQVELISLEWVNAMGVAPRTLGTAALLVGVGLYQWLPVKRACLAHCRSPFDFLVSEYRPGLPGALRMGLRHGLYCLGCCWSLMLLLFVGGVMNLLWVAGITALVLTEKLFVRGEWLRHAIGAAAMLAAAGVLL